MRKIFVIFGVLFALMFVGCSTAKPVFHSKMPANSVYIDSHNSWINHCPVAIFGSGHKSGIDCSDWRTITVRVVNTKLRDVVATVKCVYTETGIEFSNLAKQVKRGDDSVFLLWGFTRGAAAGEKVRCTISNVR